MGPVAVVAWAGLRGRLATSVLVAVALGLTGAIVLACVAGSERGREALDEFVAYSRVGTMEVFVNPALPPDELRDTLLRVIESSGEPSFSALAAVVLALPGPHGVDGDGTDFVVSEALIEGDYLEASARPIVVDGDLPLDPGEVAVNEAIRDRRGVEVGDPFPVAVFPAEDLDLIGNGVVTDPAATRELTVGAVIRQPVDLARSPQSQPGTIYESDEGRVVLHPSFLEDVGLGVANYGVGARGQPPASEIERLRAVMQEEGGRAVLVNPSGPE